MLLTLPLVPVFMWLVGRYTERRARERWQALSLLATHFLDVVRGLPTLRAFNRSEAQSAQIADVSDRYRRATMGTLRVAFLSGAVLELAATLGIALVAVTVGVRLVEGGDRVRACARRARARARALPAAAEPRRAVPRERRRTRGRRAAARSGGAAPRRRRRRAAAAARDRGGRAARRRHRRLSVATGARARRCRPRAPAARDRGARRRERGREEHASRRSCSGSCTPDVGMVRVGRSDLRCVRPRRVAVPPGLGAAAADALPRHGRRQHQARCAARDRRGGARGGRARRCRRIRGGATRAATRRRSATVDAPSRRASSSASRSRVRSCAIPTS